MPHLACHAVKTVILAGELGTRLAEEHPYDRSRW
jgi:hypothetical protein